MQINDSQPDQSRTDELASAAPRTSQRDPLRAITIVCLALLGVFLIAVITWHIVNRDKIEMRDNGMSPTIESGEMVRVESNFVRVHRGDIIEIDTASAPGWERARDDRVLRVVGMPGDRIESCEDVLVCVNGELLQEEYLPRGARTSFPAHARGSCEVESRPFGCTVPKGWLYVLGDNRHHVHDSRLYGPIPKRAIKGVIDDA